MDAQGTDTQVIRIESFGIRIDIRVESPSITEKVLPLLPPGWRPAPDSFADAEFLMWSSGNGRYVISGDGTSGVAPDVELDVALAVLASHVRSCVALWAPGRIFVHAGAVARHGRALLLPGDSFCGKTTLVAALIQAGASYYSDEFAVLDADGFVHPYAKALSVRSPAGGPTDEVSASAFGGLTGEVRLPVALVAVTGYVPDARWDPAPLSPGETALALLSHSVPAQERPAETLRVLSRVAAGCACVRSDRGEAESIVDSLLSLLEAS